MLTLESGKIGNASLTAFEGLFLPQVGYNLTLPNEHARMMVNGTLHYARRLRTLTVSTRGEIMSAQNDHNRQ